MALCCVPTMSVFYRFSLVGLCFLCGCGESGTHISGTVTFNGKPVPAGKIYFMPDNSSGNIGATGYATIEDGQYDTAQPGGKPVTCGATIVGIEGFDPAAKVERAPGDTSGEETVRPLFPYYETSAELKPDGEPADFEVPAEAARRRNKPEGPTIVP